MATTDQGRPQDRVESPKPVPLTPEQVTKEMARIVAEVAQRRVAAQ